MMLIKSITYKNFQSVGNTPITVDFTRSPSTMISGTNGAGKSNVLEALSYGLFGKPLKDLKLGGLINTINKKNLLVTVDLSIKGIDYKIVRGQKPNVLEFYVNGDLMDQSAAARDYQQKIEYILGMDFKMFTQVVVLNKERYVPFLELSTAERRKIVEDILDISVFSVMSDQLKNDIKENTIAVQDATYELDRVKQSITMQRRLIAEASTATDARTAQIDEQITQLQVKIDDIDSELFVKNTRLPDIQSLNKRQTEVEAKLTKYRSVQSQLDVKVSMESKTKTFFDTNTSCPTCKQEIDEATRTQHVTKCDGSLATMRQLATEVVEKISMLTKEKDAIVNEMRDCMNIQNEIRLAESNKRMLQGQITQLTQMKNKSDESEKLVTYQTELDTMLEKETVRHNQLNALLEEQETLNKCKDMLKDDGIKASVVRDYIEFINTRVNEYLNAMEFYINIQLDENFNDSVVAVNKEGFTYANLSTGQKCRVSLAIWLALLEVSALKNSVVTNVLMLDEVLENLDPQGVSMFMKLVREKLSHKNVFVITQRQEEFADFFRNEIKFKLVDGFTEIV